MLLADGPAQGGATDELSGRANSGDFFDELPEQPLQQQPAAGPAGTQQPAGDTLDALCILW